MKPTRNSIVQGARVAFAQKGFRATIKDVAKAAGITSPSLVFWYFKDKEELFMEVVTAATPFAHIHHLATSQLRGDPLEQLKEIAHAYLDAYADPLERQVLFQLIGNSSANEAVRQILHEQVTLVTSNHITRLINRAQQQGKICGHLDSELVGQSFLGTLYALVTRWEIENHLPWTKQTLVDQLLRLLQCPQDETK